MPDLAEVARLARGVAASSRLTDDYDEEEFSFLRAVDRYKRQYRRPHPTCREILAIFKSLGYSKGQSTSL